MEKTQSRNLVKMHIFTAFPRKQTWSALGYNGRADVYCELMCRKFKILYISFGKRKLSTWQHHMEPRFKEQSTQPGLLPAWEDSVGGKSHRAPSLLHRAGGCSEV